MHFNRKKNTVNKKCELSQCVAYTVHSETVLFFLEIILFLE